MLTCQSCMLRSNRLLILKGPSLPTEVANRLEELKLAPSLPSSTPDWIVEVFEKERQRRRIQRLRGAYTTIHREWAKRLICAALGEQKTSTEISALLEKDFNHHTSTPLRTMRLWSWLWYDPYGNPFILKWAKSLSPGDWITFLTTATANGLDEVGFIADRMHLLFKDKKWTQTLAQVFEGIRQPLTRAVQGANSESWGALKSLFTTLNHACPAVAAQIIQAWPPDMAARALEQAHPDYYDSIWWFIGGVKEHSPQWVSELGKHINWNTLLESLRQVRPGDLASIFSCQSALHRTGVKLTRSRLHQLVDIMCSCLSNCSLADIHVGVELYMSIILKFYPEESGRLAASIDIDRLARDLSLAHPKQWRPIGELSHIIREQADFFGRLIDKLDQDTFVATVTRYGPHCAYELRCLIWFLAHATRGGTRNVLASRLASSVKAACLACASEQSNLIEAMTALDQGVASTLSLELPQIPKSNPPEEPEDLKDEAASDEKLLELIREAEASGDDYDLGAIFGVD